MRHEHKPAKTFHNESADSLNTDEIEQRQRHRLRARKRVLSQINGYLI